jgi:hypothetical protein
LPGKKKIDEFGKIKITKKFQKINQKANNEKRNKQTYRVKISSE